MKITVIGAGRWGSCIAWYLDRIGNSVTLYGPHDTPQMTQFRQTRTNGLITLPESIELNYSLSDSLAGADAVVISIPSQALRGLMEEIVSVGMQDRSFILCMKGIEIATGKRLSEVVSEYTGDKAKIAVWIGPGHVQEFYRGVPNCMVIDSLDDGYKKQLVESFSSDLIRFYYGEDMIGNEIGAASKNVIGIAAGMLDGLGLSSLKGALMSRGTHEIARLIKAMGGNELSAYGLCHLGDYEATVFSEYSHNRRFGEMYVRGEKFELLAEGYYTAAALEKLSRKYSSELPICSAVYDILYNGTEARSALDRLFTRGLKQELH
ncbi:MAG: NAD(P)H-dependent glycerol-3-phosphate dehydrogenase [Clostridia bacterium]|nr:NAD(P)H-dependent glycerol-3-phosphate dehydrogenase [Clostridia bacterium]